ncbi:MAG: 2-oxoglutarate dehydrogenase E1 component [Gemmatimonadetes bacterium]|nr:MAG: 2-oxoglutarate dehydrogenase E1 component [Gemmatimonadota bacterium]
MSTTLFDDLNAAYVQDLYEAYARNPESVPPKWRAFFSRGPGAAQAAGLLVPEALEANGAPVAAAGEADPEQLRAARELAEQARAESESMRELLRVVARAAYFAQAYRDHGHQLAHIDPLGSEPPGHPQLDPEFFGTSIDELSRVPAELVLYHARPGETLADALKRMREISSGPIGYEFEHLEDARVVRWLWDQVATGAFAGPLEQSEKVRVLQRLAEVEGLEQFLHRAYLGQKRFSLEGCDMLVPMLDEAIAGAGRAGAHTVVLGMAHRGRLNVLAHTVGIGYAEILREFEGVKTKGALQVEGTGDVKYHHGAEGERMLEDGRAVRVTLAPNPSHLEFVNPVVEGMARALQYPGAEQDAARDPNAVVPILIHGDAAFAGEGVVAETLNLARLEGYSTGGTIHIIVNNQIGFTTTPEDGRSTRYASDLAKGFALPIVHVNADEPEACLTAIRLAMAYRERFNEDFVIDLVGYRRHGHNEGDEPAYTQPDIYERIRNHPTVFQIWAERLVKDGVVSEADVEAMKSRVADYFREAQDQIREERAEENGDHTDGDLPLDQPVETAVPFETLAEINAASLATPEGFTVHPKLKRQLDRRGADFGPDFELEWAHAEALAFGSLLGEGVPVRLTGQDSERGTFSQRHLVLHDAATGATVTPLADYGSARLEVHNSPLSEMGVLGFEYGYSVARDGDLVLWEAQFGDFVNAAQVTIDQFIASGWEKWGQTSRLVLLLPHGYEGQGPEHSSARLERFLQLCAEDNMRVVYPTTPAQYFHLLRRQAHARPERPLVVMTPKSLLRHPKAVSPVSELVAGGFQPVLDDALVDDPDAVTRLLMCTGKVYYDLLTSEDRQGAGHIAIVRVEELYPFPADALKAVVKRYRNASEVVWVQEEPRNMGALSYIGPRLRTVVPKKVPLRHVSRPERASPAEGKSIDHMYWQTRVVAEALRGA